MYYESTGKKIWRVIYPVLTHIVIYVLVLFGTSILLSSMGITGAAANQEMNRYAAVMTSIALIIAIPILYVFYKRDYPVRSKELFGRPVNIAVLIVLAAAASHGLNLLLSMFATGAVAESYQNVETALYSSSLLLVLARTVVLAPLCEELIFRGLMFRRLKEYTGFWAASLVSSVVFAVYHLNLLQGVFAFIFGMLLCYVYHRYQNLWASIILHAAGNLLSVILTYTGFQYPGMVLYYVVMIVMLLLAAGICLLVLPKVTVDKKKN